MLNYCTVGKERGLFSRVIKAEIIKNPQGSNTVKYTFSIDLIIYRNRT